MTPPTVPGTVESLRTMAATLKLLGSYLEAQTDDALKLESVQKQIRRYANQASHEWRGIEAFVRRHTGLARLIEFRGRRSNATVATPSDPSC